MGNCLAFILIMKCENVVRIASKIHYQKKESDHKSDSLILDFYSILFYSALLLRVYFF